MEDHTQRQHATWAPSASDRGRLCPGSTAYADGSPRTSNEYAARGTLGHQLAQQAFGAQSLCDRELIGQTRKVDGFDITIDEELLDGVDLYVEYCLSKIHEDTQHWLEQRVSLHSLKLALDVSGTVDFRIYDARDKSLEIVDLKTGFEIVDPRGNWQCRTYALGAVLCHPELDIETVRVKIIQPALSRQLEPEVITIADLVLWGMELKAAVALAGQAYDDMTATPWADWAAAYLVPGPKQCRYCPKNGVCPALRGTALRAKTTRHSNFEPEEIAKLLDEADTVSTWVKALRSQAMTMLNNDVDVPGWMLEQKMGHRKLANETVARQALQQAGVAEADMHTEPKLKSPAQLEKIKGLPSELKQRFKTDAVNSLCTVEVSSVVLSRRAEGKAEAPSQTSKWFEG